MVWLEVKVIEREKPDGIFAAFGGQTALNCAVKMYQDGVFEKYNVKVLGRWALQGSQWVTRGTQIDAIMKTEDRDLFSKAGAPPLGPRALWWSSGGGRLWGEDRGERLL